MVSVWMHSLQMWNLMQHWRIFYNILSISLVSNLTEATPRDCGSGARGFRHSTDRLWEEIIIITTETNEKHQFWLVQLPSWLIGNRPVTIGASKIMSTGSITLPHSLCSRLRFARPIFSTLLGSLFAGKVQTSHWLDWSLELLNLWKQFRCFNILAHYDKGVIVCRTASCQ